MDINITYRIDGTDLKSVGVFVSDSEGVINRPKLKAVATTSWDDYHGEDVDLQYVYYAPRDITLSCFVVAPTTEAFLSQMLAFQRLLDGNRLHRLMIEVGRLKPLVYEVYCKEGIEVEKKWKDGRMAGTFKLKFTEPQPLKRVLQFSRTSEQTKQCTITLTSTKLVNIYWGDGSVDEDISGRNRTIVHQYAQNGVFYPIVAGCIDEIETFKTNATEVWSRL